MAVGEVDRCVLWAHNQCLELGLPFGQTPHSSERACTGFPLKLLPTDVVDAEGLGS